jgi:hypothetical protein
MKLTITEKNRLPKVAGVVLAAIFLSACAASKHRDSMDAFTESWEKGDYQAAGYGDVVDTPNEEVDLADRGLLDLLHLAEATRMSGDDEFAIAAYDETEKVYRRFDEKNIVEEGAGQLGAILINDSARDYRGNIYEATLVNSYKALSFLSIAKPDLARVEFNRADDRTRRAVEFYAEEIKEQKESLAEEEEKQQEAQSVEATLEADATQQTLNEVYGNVSEWNVYPDFINPFVTYLHGLFFLASDQDAGDVERARVSLDRVAEMTRNPAAQSDAQLAAQLSSGEIERTELGNLIWVVYENGQGPTLDEKRFDLPLFLVTQGEANKPTYAAIALPEIESGSAAHDELYLNVGGEDLEATTHLSSMERVVRTEFKEKFTGVLTRSIASAILNMALQAEASNQAGLLGAVAATAFTAATTEADLRIWRAMPHSWQVARIARPDEGVIGIRAGSAQNLASFEAPEWPYTLVYIKQPSVSAEPVIKIIDLQGKNPARHMTTQGSRQIAGSQE